MQKGGELNMPTWLLIAITLIVGCFITAFITAHICNREFKSSWQVIKYTGDSVEPKDVYICKNCNKITNLNYCYCSNCGAMMKNGITRVYYPDDIDLSE